MERLEIEGSPWEWNHQFTSGIDYSLERSGIADWEMYTEITDRTHHDYDSEISEIEGWKMCPQNTGGTDSHLESVRKCCSIACLIVIANYMKIHQVYQYSSLTAIEQNNRDDGTNEMTILSSAPGPSSIGLPFNLTENSGSREKYPKMTERAQLRPLDAERRKKMAIQNLGKTKVPKPSEKREARTRLRCSYCQSSSFHNTSELK